MNYKIKSLLLLLLICISCKKDASIVFTSDRLIKEFRGNCDTDDCPEVVVEYLNIEGDEEVSEKINSNIKNFIIASLDLEEENSTKPNTIADAANKFIKNYEKDKTEFPEIGTYFAEISVKESYFSEDILCFEMRQYLFTGGAHGYGSVHFLNIDPKTGNEILTEELLKNEPDFLAFGEKKFRQEMEIPIEGSINSTGFWFENDVFYLPETIGFSKDEVIFLYNQYEIASYASGPIELLIPIKEALPYLVIK